MNTVERPDMKYVIGLLNAAHREENPRERASKDREVYDYLRKYYEQYIESMSARIEELEEKGTILAEIIAVKKMVAKL
jgi:hypothetical protein